MTYNFSNPKPRVGLKDLLYRPDIDKLLADSMNSSLTSIVAGAGYGKTQAVLSFLSEINVNVAWIQFTSIDNYSARFWEGFIQAISVVDEELSLLLQQYEFPDDLAKFHQFLKIFSKKLYSDEPYIIVFDDCHLITNKSIIRFIENIVLANLENLSVFVLSRSSITMSNLNIMDSTKITYIDKNQLAFSFEETKEYFNKQNIELSNQDLNHIFVQTEGWAFAIYLVSLHIKRGGYQKNNSVVYTNPIIFDMIESEIFSLYPDDIQHILVKLSLIDNFSLSLVKNLIGDNIYEVIELLESNMFINYNAHTKHYHFHHLFLEYLTEKQTDLENSEIRDVYQITANWYESNGMKLDALLYYKKYNDYNKLWKIIWDFNPGRFSKEVSDLFIDIIDSFPEYFVYENPLISIIRACLNMTNLDLMTSIKRLEEIIEELKSRPYSEKNNIAMGESHIMLAFYYRILSTLEFKTHFITASKYLPNGSTMFDKKFYIINTDYSFSLKTGDPGELDQIITNLLETMPYIEKVMNGSGYGWDSLALAETSYLRGNIKKAMEYSYQAVYKAISQEQADIIGNGYYILCKISIYNGNYTEALANLEQVRKKVDIYGYDNFFSLPDIAEGWFYSKMDCDENVPQWIHDDNFYENIEIPLLVSKERLINAYILLKNKKYRELNIFINNLESIYISRNLYFPLIELYVIKALSYFSVSDYKQSLQAMKKAFDMSYHNDIIMPFIELGQLICDYIDFLREYDNTLFPAEWLSLIYTRAATYAKRLSYAKTKFDEDNNQDDKKTLLTEREKNILQNICEGLTREEISDLYDISINTVKNSLKNIYSKLGAINAIDAARIATLKGIIK